MIYSHLLGILIEAFYRIVLVLGIIGIGLLIYSSLAHGDFSITAENSVGAVNKEFMKPMIWKDYIKLSFSVFEVIFFIKTIYHLRNGTLKLIEGEIFTNYVSTQLRWTGISIIVYELINQVKSRFIEMAYEGQFTLGIDFKGFESFIFIIILGLFFILFSNVINHGRQLKQENELTI